MTTVAQIEAELITEEEDKNKKKVKNLLRKYRENVQAKEKEKDSAAEVLKRKLEEYESAQKEYQDLLAMPFDELLDKYEEQSDMVITNITSHVWKAYEEMQEKRFADYLFPTNFS